MDWYFEGNLRTIAIVCVSLHGMSHSARALSTQCFCSTMFVSGFHDVHHFCQKSNQKSSVMHSHKTNFEMFMHSEHMKKQSYRDENCQIDWCVCVTHFAHLSVRKKKSQPNDLLNKIRENMLYQTSNRGDFELFSLEFLHSASKRFSRIIHYKHLRHLVVAHFWRLIDFDLICNILCVCRLQILTRQTGLISNLTRYPMELRSWKIHSNPMRVPCWRTSLFGKTAVG